MAGHRAGWRFSSAWCGLVSYLNWTATATRPGLDAPPRRPSRRRVPTSAVTYVGVFAAITWSPSCSGSPRNGSGCIGGLWLTGWLIDRSCRQRLLPVHRAARTSTIRISGSPRTSSRSRRPRWRSSHRAQRDAQLVLFAGVLWSIAPMLFSTAIGYATAGTLFDAVLGRRLVGSISTSSKREADLRYELIRVREHADRSPCITAGRRKTAAAAPAARLAVDNFRRIVSVNRNVGFFTTGYNYWRP